MSAGRRTTRTSKLDDRLDSIEVKGRKLTRGTEFTVHGAGRHRVMAIRPNGEINAWGPLRKLTKGQEKADFGSTRTFTVDQIKNIYY